MFQCIRSAGFQLTAMTAATPAVAAPSAAGLKLQTELIVDHLLRTIQTHVITQLNEIDLRYCCSLFLEIPFGAQDVSVSTPSENVRDPLVTLLKSKRARGASVIVLGACGCGKSRMIQDAMNCGIDANPKSELGGFESSAKAPSAQYFTRISRVLNPWAMQDSGAAVDCVEALTSWIKDDYASHTENALKTNQSVLRMVH